MSSLDRCDELYRHLRINIKIYDQQRCCSLGIIIEGILKSLEFASATPITTIVERRNNISVQSDCF